MEKMNKKGFTLIELLAVIVILALLVAVAIPAVTKYLNTSRAGVFADNAAAAISAVRNDVITKGLVEFESDGAGNMTRTYTIDYINKNLLEKKINNSPYGGKFDQENSEVKVEYKDNKYTYSIFLTDDVNCIGSKTTDGKSYVEENNLNGQVKTSEPNSTGVVIVGDSTRCEDKTGESAS